MYKNSQARERVLQRLREMGPASVDELAHALGVVPVTMRTHLAALEAQGLIDWHDERGRVGRPRRRYRLTEKAAGLLPHRYAGLTVDLLDSLESLAGKRGVEQLWDLTAARYAAQHAAAVTGHTLAKRVPQVTQLLREESGFADYVQEGERWLIRDLHCPYSELVRKERLEVCQFHVQVLTRLLGEPVRLERSIAVGEPHCLFSVSNRPAPRAKAVRTMSDGRQAPDPA